MDFSKLRSRWVWMALVLAGGGCAHAEPVATSPTAQQQASGAEGRAAAPVSGASAAARAAQAGAPAPGPADDASENLDTYMVEHFVLATYARDAVITGHLGALRRALGALADYKYEHVSPGDWKPWIARMQAAARPGASATTLDEAALAVANTAAVCGECHREHRAGPQFPKDDDPDGEAGLSNTLSDRMERHVWAANRLWEGLIAPSDPIWRMGSAELANVPLKAPKEKPALSSQFVQQLRQVRELGDRARGASEPAERVAVYARVLSTCARCHEQEMKTTF